MVFRLGGEVSFSATVIERELSHVALSPERLILCLWMIVVSAKNLLSNWQASPHPLLLTHLSENCLEILTKLLV